MRADLQGLSSSLRTRQLTSDRSDGIDRSSQAPSQRSVLRWSWIVEPMTHRVRSSHHHTFLIPTQSRANVRAAISQRQTAAPTIGIVGSGAMQQQVAVQ